MPVKTTQEEFIKRAKGKYGDLYDYSLVRYIRNCDKIEIICSKHGVFLQTPNAHLCKKFGCKKCAMKIKKHRPPISTEKFIEKAVSIHGHTYDYSLVHYINQRSKIKIICSIHGIFEQAPNDHINQKSGCSKCNSLWIKSNTNEFIEKAIKNYGDKYNYKLVNYINAITKINLICNTCYNIIGITPQQHLRNEGGCICYSRKFYTMKNFIKKAKDIHGNLYVYIDKNFYNSNNKLNIFCVRCKKVFKQSSTHHFLGHGCSNCNGFGKVSENKLLDLIQKTFLNFIVEHQGKPKWLGRQTFDVYFPEYNIAIEYMGEQHFKSIKYFGGEGKFLETKERDERKLQLCLDNNCKLLYFTYFKEHIPLDYPHKVYTDEEELINEIKEILNY